MLEYILENKLVSTFPNIFIAIRILLTLPVSIATGERSFSKLKLTKNYLRATMSQTRLSDLGIISKENNILDSLDLRDLIASFAESKVLKMQFL
ncbi:hypothetical protein DD592_27420 [Enterobacter cloacae complex sp. 2DZ2F20B]|nr:hypothetical protein DD592_27420 [Enterobacter cloacae complex sp. 2DZ2F20B]